MADPATPPVPEMVGATSAPFNLSESPTQIDFEIHAPTGPALIGGDRVPRSAFLGIEEITGKTEAPPFSVYLNLPDGANPARHPYRFAGSLPMFGLKSMSQVRGHHPANGITYRFDVTNVLLRLAVMGEWNAKSLRVTFVAKEWPAPVEAQVGRVSLYYK